MPLQQLTLNVNLRDGLRFSSFYAPPESTNFDTVRVLQSFIASNQPQQNILWGEKGSGKTHLLQACCAVESESNHSISYFPLSTLKDYGQESLSGLTHSCLVVVDDVDCVLNDRAWEMALFSLINTTRENNQRLLLSASKNPRKLECLLPDLASRLIWGGSYQLHALTDKEKEIALRLRAEQRGFKLSERVIDYLFRRYPRDFESLLRILDKLDEESLRHKTVITVPFVKKVLE